MKGNKEDTLYSTFYCRDVKNTKIEKASTPAVLCLNHALAFYHQAYTIAYSLKERNVLFKRLLRIENTIFT